MTQYREDFHGRWVEQTIYYDGIDVGTRRADFIL